LEKIFTESSRPPSPEPTIAKYIRDSNQIRLPDDWKEIEIRLVGTHPLWGHYLWNAALATASFLDSNRHLFLDRNVLELGAGGGLPSIVTVKNGARKVIVTDYPDANLLENLAHNVAVNLDVEERRRVDVQGYVWGKPVHSLLEPLSLPSQSSKFDLIILSDLVFNHSQHDALLNTCEWTISAGTGTSQISVPDACVLVFFTHHKPKLAHRDMQFFTKAKERGWICNEIYTKTFQPMFPDDLGEESIRSTVHGWKLHR
jgi:nicotinamide N-methyltransferase